jgi:hypothetical protein
LLLSFAPLSLASQVQRAGAQTSTIDIIAVDAQTGIPIPYFKWVVNLDNSHDLASITPPASYSPVIASGDQSNALGVELEDTAPPNRGYLVTALANDGVGTLNDPDYKIGGAHFSMPDGDGVVIVQLQPNPLPLATLKVRVFHDNHMVNGEDDIPQEEGLAGFHVILMDRVGEVTTDWFGNPICTEYLDYPGGTPAPGTGGFCVSDSEGWATIPNLGPDKYAVEVIPPDGSGWVQTTTIEGKHEIDAWLEEGHSGYSTEEGFQQAAVWFGFVRECQFGNTSDDCTSATADMSGKKGLITGTARSISLDDESGVIQLGNPVVSPYIALNNIGGNDEQVYTGRGNPDGTFTIPNVPAGLYQLVVWDLPLDHIIQFFTVEVPKDNCGGNLRPCTVDIGDIGVPRWFGKIRGTVYIDDNENGIRDAGEVSLPFQDLDTRFKDGTIQYTAFADGGGNYEFPEVFELEHFTIAEVGYGRFKQTGAAGYETDQFGVPINYPGGFVNQDLGLASLLQGAITWAGTTNYIDWGKKPFAAGENGGIVGIVFYAMTRNELDARLQAAEDYEPGVPNTPLNLYAPELDQNGNPVYDPTTGEILKDHLAAVYKGGAGTDSWYDDTLPTECIPRGSVGRTPGQVQPQNIFSDCIELPALLNQIRPGVFDGGYAFDADCFDPNGLAATDPDNDIDGDGTPNRFDPDLLLDYDVGACPALPAGKWVVQVVPLPGYQVVKEEDINVFSGDVFVPAIPPPPCVGPLHQVDVQGVAPDGMDDGIPSTPIYNPDFAATPEVLAPSGFGSPYEGQMKPMCNERLIDLATGQNANSDFFVFTDVPQPGRIVGVLLDDLVLELDPASPMYAEKRGIPNAPVGIRDYTGRLITTVYSDENGYWEVLLPSTDTYNCALPAGPCPGMYQVVGNDPGTPTQPNAGWNPNYGTLKLTFDVWPGLTTYADVAILPVTGFVQGVNSQFETPPVCDIPGTTPDLQSISQPYGSSGDSGSFFIYGFNFGASQGSGMVTLGGTPLPVNTWGDTTIEIEMAQLSLVSAGPHQLLVSADNGQTSPVGITFHVLGAGYNPPQRHVGAGQTYATIQAALSTADDGDLILVHPGNYFETLLIEERVKLQGYGVGAGGSAIDGRFFNFGGVSADDFAALIASTAYDGPATVPMGQVITVLAEQGEFTPAGFDHAQIDGFAIRGGTRVRGNVVAPSQGGGIYAHAYATSLEVSNNLVQSNAGNMGGGVIFGQPYVTNPDDSNRRDNQNDNVRLHHNRVLNNGGVSTAGALALFNGTQNFEIDHNVVCGNYSAEYGGGISNFGFSSGSIHDNQILYNFAFDEGGGIMTAGEQPVGNPLGLSAGTGDVDIERNLVQGNVSNDDGGGIRLLAPVAGRIRIINNIVVDNLATDAGGGIALDDALSVQIINNTLAENVSTATAEDADRTTCSPPLNGTCPHGAGLVSEGHSQALLDALNNHQFNCNQVNCVSNFSDPVLFNNIFWQNEAFYLDGNLDLLGTQGLPSAGYMDLEVLSGGAYSGQYNDCTAFTNDCPSGGGNHNISADPLFLSQVDLNFQALAFSGDPSFVTVIVKSTPGDPQGNYHVPGGSPVVNEGTDSLNGTSAPCNDFDGDGRPNGNDFDIGADEQPGVSGAGCITPPPPPPPPSDLLYFSTATNFAVPGVPTPDDADIYAWNGPGFSRIFDGSAAGLPGNANIDALLVVDSDTFYMSFTRDAGTTVPTIGVVQDEDVVLYDAGTWSLFFDGSPAGVGLGDSNAEDVDALNILPSGNILVSTLGNPTLPGVASPADEDLFVCVPTFTAGTVTSCAWTMYFEGSDIGLTENSEDVDGVTILGSDIYFSTLGAFGVPAAPTLSGNMEDVWVCSAATTGAASACASYTLFFDGSLNGMTDNLDAIDLP